MKERVALLQHPQPYPQSTKGPVHQDIVFSSAALPTSGARGACSPPLSADGAGRSVLVDWDDLARGFTKGAVPPLLSVTEPSSFLRLRQWPAAPTGPQCCCHWSSSGSS